MELVVASIEALRSELTAAFETLAADGPMACGISGGGPALLYLPALREARTDWSRVSLFWLDERAEGPDDPGSYFDVARRMLLDPLQPEAPRVFPMPAAGPVLAEAALDYDDALDRELQGGPLDLAIVGVGEDGHIGSLFPGHQGVAATESRVVAIEDSPRPPRRRLSLSLSFLARSRQVWVIALGTRKRHIVQAAITKFRTGTPFDLLLLQAPHLTIYTDQAVHHN